MHKKLSSLILNMTDEYFSTLPFREAHLYSMLLLFFTILGRNYRNPNYDPSYIENNKQLEYIEALVNVCKYMDVHYTENIKLDDIANAAGFSKYHFARLFKQAMNMSWYDYLLDRRIKQAERLLMESDLPVMEIAMKSGFGSLATFNRLFKSKKCCTPTEYRSFYKKII